MKKKKYQDQVQAALWKTHDEETAQQRAICWLMLGGLCLFMVVLLYGIV